MREDVSSCAHANVAGKSPKQANPVTTANREMVLATGRKIAQTHRGLLERLKDDTYATPSEGGCWYCYRKDGDLWFCWVFDAYVHPECLKMHLQANTGDAR